MELIIEPDTYTPSIDDIGNYIDKIPSFNTIKYGIRCNCGSRKDKKYETYNNFYAHIKTKIHRKWLSELNTNKANYYIENENLKHTLHNQKMIIAKLDKELNSKNMTIGYLTQQLTNNNNNNNKIVNDLIFFD